MLHRQSFDLGGLLLTKGFALDLGPGFATVVGLTLSLGLCLLAAGKRGSGWLASGRKCSHRRPPQKKRRGGRRACPRAVCGGGGSDQSHITVANGNHTMPGRSHGIAVTNDEAENAPRLTVTYGEDLKESTPPLEGRVETHTAKLTIA